MEEALKKAVEEFGRDIILEPRLVGVLADYRAYERQEYNRELLRMLYRAGLLSLYVKESDEISRMAIMRRFADGYALNESRVWPLMELLYAAYRGLPYNDCIAVQTTQSSSSSPSVQIPAPSTMPQQQQNEVSEYVSSVSDDVLPPRSDIPSELLNLLREVSFVFKKENGPDAKYGIANAAGEILHDAIYDEISKCSEDFCVACIGDLWGYVHAKRRFSIAPQFTEAQSFSDGVAVIKTPKSNGCCSIIDANGNILAHTKYDCIGNFKKGRADVLSKNNLWGYIDRYGKLVIPFKYQDTSGFMNNGLALADEKGRCKTIDKDGNTCKEFDRPFECLRSEIWDDGYILKHALVENGSKKGVLDSSGNEVLPCRYDLIIRRENRPDILELYRSRLGSENWKEGASTINGKIIIPARYDLVVVHEKENLIIVQKGKKCGVRSFTNEINIWGNLCSKWVVPCKYEYLRFWGTDGYVAKKGGKCGIMDRQQKWIVQPKYDHIQYEGSDLFQVLTIDGKWGVMDIKERFVIRPSCEKIFNVEKNGMTVWLAYRHKRLNVFDMDGQYLYGSNVPSIEEEVMDLGL